MSVFSITTFITDRSRAVFARQSIRVRAVTQYCTQVGWHGSNVLALQQKEAVFEYKPEVDILTETYRASPRSFLVNNVIQHLEKRQDNFHITRLVIAVIL